MDKTKGASRVIEPIKTLLILLLACSAVYLTLRSQVFGDLSGLWDSGGTFAGSTLSENLGSDIARPVRMVAVSESGRYGVQYNTEGTDALFTNAAGLLSEALGNAGEPAEVKREEWQQALTTAPAIYFDFLGAIPLSTLQTWLASGQLQPLTGAARQLILAVGGEDTVLLYYHNEDDGLYYACPVEVVRESQLRSAVSGVQVNGARFAFEEEEFTHLAPDTLLLPDPPQLPACQASSPLAGERGEEVQDALAEALSFQPQGNAMYQAPDGSTVIKSGPDTLRVRADGLVTFSSGTVDDPRFLVGLSDPVAEVPSRTDLVQTAYALVADVLLPHVGEGRIYLKSVEPLEEGVTQVAFGYCLWGAEVALEQGEEAARVVLSNQQVVSFSMVLRTYESSGQPQPALPELQAQAALAALGQQGAELRMCYFDSLTEPVTAGWIAA